MFLFIIGILSYSGSDVIDNGPVSPALSEQPVTGERQACFCSALHKQVKMCFIRSYHIIFNHIIFSGLSVREHH